MESPVRKRLTESLLVRPACGESEDGVLTGNPPYSWDLVDNETYPFLSWQP
jgi:hypothetical protein